MKRHVVKIAGYMIIFIDNKLLLMKRKNSGFYDGRYTIPSGHIEINESPLEGAIRETLEETNLSVTKTSFSCVIHRTNKHRLNDDYVDFFFLCNSYTGTIKNNEPDKCSEIILVDINKLPEILMIPYVKLAIENLFTKELKYLSVEDNVK